MNIINIEGIPKKNKSLDNNTFGNEFNQSVISIIDNTKFDKLDQSFTIENVIGALISNFPNGSVSSKMDDLCNNPHKYLNKKEYLIGELLFLINNLFLRFNYDSIIKDGYICITEKNKNQLNYEITLIVDKNYITHIYLKDINSHKIEFEIYPGSFKKYLNQ